MPVRRTSIEAYNQIKAEGLLSNLRFQVYDTIHRYKPVNITQIIKFMKADGFQVENTGSITGRISELVERKVIQSAYEGKCPITGRVTNFWETTSSLPEDPDKTPEPKVRIKKPPVFYWIGPDKIAYESRERAILCGCKPELIKKVVEVL